MPRVAHQRFVVLERGLEQGGADVLETYNFAWLRYAVVSVRWRP